MDVLFISFSNFIAQFIRLYFVKRKGLVNDHYSVYGVSLVAGIEKSKKSET